MSRINPIEHYKNIISELLLEKEGTFSTGVTKQTKVVMAKYNCKAGEDSLPLFMEEIRGLSKCDMERLNHALHEVFTILSDEVDEVQFHILGFYPLCSTSFFKMRFLQSSMMMLMTS